MAIPKENQKMIEVFSIIIVGLILLPFVAKFTFKALKVTIMIMLPFYFLLLIMTIGYCTYSILKIENIAFPSG